MAATNSPRPRPKGLSVIKSNLLRPALTSHYDVFISEPSTPANSDPGGYTWSKYKNENGLTGFSQDLLHLSCCNATLPGSSLMTHEQLYDRTGVTEKHAYRKTFDGKIDLTFYVMISPSNVDAQSATPIDIFLLDSLRVGLNIFLLKRSSRGCCSKLCISNEISQRLLLVG